MHRAPRPFSTAQTLLWFAVLSGVWQLSPVDERWKLLPDLRDTFLVQGLHLEAHSDPLAAGAGLNPPLPSENTANEEGDHFYDDINVSRKTGDAAAPAVPGAERAAATNPNGLDPSHPVSPVGELSSPPSGQDSAQSSAEGSAPGSIKPTTSSGGLAPSGNAYSLSGPSSPSANVVSPPPPRAGSLVAPLPEPQPIEQGCLQGTPDNCTRLALAPFWESLASTLSKQPGAITRISHFGDSVIASDYVSATVRRRLQRQFGDAGHGFILAARPWRWYDHRGIFHAASAQWKPHGVVFNRYSDRYFGFGGVSFQTGEEGATIDLGTASDGNMGRAVGRIELYYYAQPGGGTLNLSLNGAAQEPLHTAAELAGSAYRLITQADGPARLHMSAVGDGPVRLFGATFERTTPGVVYDSIGLVGGSVPALRKIDRRQWNEHLAHRSPDLIILNFGANESLTYNDATPKAMRDYSHSLGSFIRVIQAARPGCSVLVMGPMDAAQVEGEYMVSRPSIAKLRAAQREAALDNGAAFWDTYGVMGGDGAMPRWVRSRLGSSDMVHPSWQAAVFLGNELARSILTTFEKRDSGELVASSSASPMPAIQRPFPAAKIPANVAAAASSAPVGSTSAPGVPPTSGNDGLAERNAFAPPRTSTEPAPASPNASGSNTGSGTGVEFHPGTGSRMETGGTVQKSDAVNRQPTGSAPQTGAPSPAGAVPASHSQDAHNGTL